MENVEEENMNDIAVCVTLEVMGERQKVSFGEVSE